jgi:hypothetical protein
MSRANIGPNLFHQCRTVSSGEELKYRKGFFDFGGEASEPPTAQLLTGGALGLTERIRVIFATAKI